MSERLPIIPVLSYCLIIKELVTLDCPDFFTGGKYQCPNCGDLDTDSKLADHLVRLTMVKEAILSRRETGQELEG
jgi:hypothetical protein